ncbi:MAG TPA: YdeI/OmpD-associated family protein [Kouleothrix sp.]|uniref:YdeI/OmpD-associated family protein n=1 Tax=Kouleothrix sp. TaxID=2779161 RepID=UPI002BC141DC|nr:YdeI/OmpD-associated family protein [Kouleothrix sp.]
MKTTFTTTIQATGNNTGIEVPPENVAELGSSKKPAVTVHVSGYSYSSTVAVMGGRFMIPLSKAHREAAGLSAGETVEVTLELETAPRTTHVPDDLRAALATAGAEATFDALAFSKRKEFVRQVEDAKTPETRARRIENIVRQMTEI